jgi:hypothetical protein
MLRFDVRTWLLLRMNVVAPSLTSEVIADQMMMPSPIQPISPVIMPPMTAEETTVIPSVITRTLMVS